MKRTGLFLILLTLSMCLNEYYNVDKREDAEKWVNEILNDLNSENKVSVSDCVDRNLAIEGGGIFDKCCYYRMMINGKIIEGCTGLLRDDTMDVPGYIELSEKQTNGKTRFLKRQIWITEKLCKSQVDDM